LDGRIAAAFSNGVTSDAIPPLLAAAKAARVAAAAEAEAARVRALDPVLPSREVSLARAASDDAAFRRDRLAAAVTKLAERRQQLEDQEEIERRQLAYNKASAERDKLAAELADLYPAFAKKLGELCTRVAANDREIEYINQHALPKGGDRLLVAELKARGLLGWVTNSIHARRIIELLCLPPWHPRAEYAWPPGGR
jgi:hypothetical protein